MRNRKSRDTWRLPAPDAVPAGPVRGIPISMRVYFLLLISACVGWPADLPPALAARMDETARGLKSFSADLKEIDHTAIVNDDAALSGIFRMRKVKPGDTRLLIEYR